MLYILAVLVLAIVALLAFASTRPEDFAITRHAVIPASPDKVFPHINNLHKWEAWSPWAKMDPNSKSEYSGPDDGAGAAMHWRGNNKVGEGIMTIVNSLPNARVEMRLDFLRPFKATNTAILTLAPEGSDTMVTWSMTGKNNLMAKVMNLFINCDKMVGGQFEKGLANLKDVVAQK